MLGRLRGTPALVALLLYGAGLRLDEGLALRVKDVDLARGELLVRAGEGGKDRRTVLPDAAREPLAAHLAHVRDLHARDLGTGGGRTPLRTPWHASSRALPANGHGSSPSRPPADTWTRRPGSASATTSTDRRCSVR